jgi:hypothetical protein
MHRDHRSENRGIVISMLWLVDGKLRALETAAISGKQGLWRERPNPSMTGMQPAAKLFMGICPAFRPQLFQSSFPALRRSKGRSNQREAALNLETVNLSTPPDH